MINGSLSFIRHGSFNFLGLPRELRDEVYSYALGANGDIDLPMYDSIKTQAHHHFRSGVRISRRCISKRPLPNSAVLSANSQLNRESLDTVYRENTFFVTVDPDSPIFNSRGSKKDYDPAFAIPFGWDLSRITKLCLRIGLGREETADDTFSSFQWPGLLNMKNLKQMRLIITTWDESNGTDPQMTFLNDHVDDDGVSRCSAPYYREMMRKLARAVPESVLKFDFGIESLPANMRPSDWSNCIRSVPGEALSHAFNEARANKDKIEEA